MSTTQKLTKKQKKGLAFRERKTGKRQTKDDLDEMEAAAVPIMEDQDIAGGDRDSVEAEGTTNEENSKAGDNTFRDEEKYQESKVGSNGKGKTAAKAFPVFREVTKPGKRKRGGGEGEGGEVGGVEEPGQSTKRTKGIDSSSEDGKLKRSKQRFILFVGNLKYTTSRDMVEAHFANCDPPPAVRLLTPKALSTNAQRLKSKGCAFLEFTHRNALQQGLKFHQTMLDGRVINVELTAGGGGKSDSRLEKVRERNKALLEQRTQRLGKEAAENDSFTDPNVHKPQRYSATSGIEQQPINRRTWTVGDVDDGETHRGGQKHKRGKKTKSASKAWGTGVNAIPVG